MFIVEVFTNVNELSTNAPHASPSHSMPWLTVSIIPVFLCKKGEQGKKSGCASDWPARTAIPSIAVHIDQPVQLRGRDTRLAVARGGGGVRGRLRSY